MNELEKLLADSNFLPTEGSAVTATQSAEPTDREALVLARLHDTVSRRALEDGLLDVAYRTVDSPVGKLLLAATPAGLVRVAFTRQDHDTVLAELAARISPRLLHAPKRLDDAARQLDQYFHTEGYRFDLVLDLQLAHGFRRAVLERLPQIEYGQTISYAGLAAEVGNPRAVRAVGTACATNPLPLVIPCHRVIRSDGAPGAYVGGAEVKQTLLNRERATG